MSRPPVFDLDELLAFWETGEYRTAPELMEAIGIPEEHLRAVRAAINRNFGPRPKRLNAAVRNDKLRRRVVAAMIATGLDPHRCHACPRTTVRPMYIRETAQDDEISSLVFVCRDCKRAGEV